MSTDGHRRLEAPEKPPLFARWSRWYAVVLIELALIVAAAYWLTEAYQ